MKLTIDDVRAEREAVDRLIWKTTLTLADMTPDKLYLLVDITGELTLRMWAYAQNSRLHATRHALRLRASWDRLRSGYGMRVQGGQELELEFYSALPGNALERIDGLSGDVLRVELACTVCWVPVRTNNDVHEKMAEILDSKLTGKVEGRRLGTTMAQVLKLGLLLENPANPLSRRVDSKPFELSQSRWQRQIMDRLRPGTSMEAGASADPETDVVATPTSATAALEADVLAIDVPDALADARRALEARDFAACVEQCARVAQSEHQQMTGRSDRTLQSPAHDALVLQAKGLARVSSDRATAALARHMLWCTASLYHLNHPY